MSSAEIFDRGYRKFEGERSGVGGAIRSLSWQTTRSILGLGRKARHKIFPILVIAIAFLPAIIYVGMAALFPADSVRRGRRAARVLGTAGVRDIWSRDSAVLRHGGTRSAGARPSRWDV